MSHYPATPPPPPRQPPPSPRRRADLAQDPPAQYPHDRKRHSAFGEGAYTCVHMLA